MEGPTPATQAISKTGRAGKDQRKIVTAVARELLGFIWAIGTRAETGLQAASCSLTTAKTKLPKKEKRRTPNR